jgi:8-oxo-dGTP pyrophosphatase MutT (NUDIX family)
MSFSVQKGINESELADFLDEAAKKWGTFKDGRVDYTNADIAPIIMCTVVCDNEILLVKRGYGLADAEGYWSTINGFIDEKKPVAHSVVQELQEELGLKVSPSDIRVAPSFTLSNPKEKRSYIAFACKLTLKAKPAVVLNEEHTDYTWITRDQLEDFHILDDLPYAVDAALTLA